MHHKNNGIPFKVIFVICNLLFINCSTNVFCKDVKKDTTLLTYELFYETLQPLKIKSARLYISPDRLLGKSDSIKITIAQNVPFKDTLYANYPWKFPVHAWIKLEFENKTFVTNKFYLDPLNKTWQISISDTAAIIKAKSVQNFTEKKTNIQVILIIQILLELFLAILFTRIFHWPAWAILVVLAANMASYPIYMLKIHPSYLADLLMLIIKFLVIFLTSRKRLGITRIILLVTTLTVISFGIKELLIVVFKLI